MSKIILENVSKSYRKGSYAVQDINLSIEDGEFIVFVGPSGCGKSTTLRMIAGLESISDGRLWIEGEDMTHAAPKDRDLAMVFQDFALYPNMTVYKNLQYPLKMKKLARDQADQKIKEIADLLGLTDLLDRKPGQLSGGQKQRVALGRAIVREAKAFLMDEPLSNLDAKLRVSMRYEISKLHQDLKATMIYVTHDQTEAMTMADRIVVMNDGRIQQVSRPEEIYQSPANLFVAEFMGSQKINIFESQLQDGRVTLANGQKLTVEAEDEEVLVGVRPENLSLVDGNRYRVNLVEHLGPEKFVYLSSETADVIVKVDYDREIQVDDQFNLQVNQLDRLNVFSKASQKALEV